MLRIGLTGGIGSGKSTVAELFVALGAPVIDADQIAHRLTQPGTPATRMILEAFGKDVAENGGIDRRRLAQLVFADIGKRKRLEAILHPLIIAEMEMEAGKLSTPYCLLVIPLLIEAGQTGLVDRVLVVSASTQTRMQRVKDRDGRSPDEIQQIMQNQADETTQQAAADDWITNENGLESLEKQVRKLHEKYLRMAGA